MYGVNSLVPIFSRSVNVLLFLSVMDCHSEFEISLKLVLLQAASALGVVTVDNGTIKKVLRRVSIEMNESLRRIWGVWTSEMSDLISFTSPKLIPWFSNLTLGLVAGA